MIASAWATHQITAAQPVACYTHRRVVARQTFWHMIALQQSVWLVGRPDDCIAHEWKADILAFMEEHWLKAHHDSVMSDSTSIAFPSGVNQCLSNLSTG